ncbi:MAG: DNA-directed RNA polymerase subunit alpha [Mollicutes bacterium PWAP]|nr:DNA-directed RNA polymerase subunit alpha [Mollicutes bacterium PWAP]
MKTFKSLKFTKASAAAQSTASENEVKFELQPLERGLGNTLGNSIRRILLSSITSVSPFAIKMTGVNHEFQSIKGVVEDVVRVILNSKQIVVKYDIDSQMFEDNKIVKLSYKGKSSQKRNKVYGSDLVSEGIEILNGDQYLFEIAGKENITFEIYFTSGRGFMPYDKNKLFIENNLSEMNQMTKIPTNNGEFIAIDSLFSPVEQVSFSVEELNSSSAIIEEKLNLIVKTNGSISPEESVSLGAHIFRAHLESFSNLVENEKEEVFSEERIIEEDTNNEEVILITDLGLSQRSYNCLKRAGYITAQEVAKLLPKELKGIKNLGSKSADEIIDKLTAEGLYETVEGEK